MSAFLDFLSVAFLICLLIGSRRAKPKILEPTHPLIPGSEESRRLWALVFLGAAPEIQVRWLRGVVYRGALAAGKTQVEATFEALDSYLEGVRVEIKRV